MERYGDFELIRLIATGGMAEIYLGHQAGMEGFSRPVVVKRMLPQLAVRPDFVTMFLDEARLAANLNHPNIVAVTNLGEVDSSYFIAMELVDGPHLGALFAHSLRLRKPLPLEQCCYIVARAADGLHYAHEQLDPATQKPLGLVHRDISPQNILVSRAGEVKVTDFGVAKASTHQTKTRTGIIKGKVAYMSPEQCLGEVVDCRTDVFALGIVLYELLTRRRLFREKSDLLIMQKITGEDVPPPSTVNKEADAELDAICKKALARKREERYQTAAELAEAIDDWLIGQSIGDPRATLARWFEANAIDLAVSSGEMTQAKIATASMSRPMPTRENTAATPSLNSAETVMTRSRPEERLPSRVADSAAPGTAEPELTRRTAATNSEPTSDDPETVVDPGARARALESIEAHKAATSGAGTDAITGDGLGDDEDEGPSTAMLPLSALHESTAFNQKAAGPSRLPLAAGIGLAVLAAGALVFALSRDQGPPPDALADALAMTDGGAASAGAVADAGVQAPVPSARPDAETVTIETVPEGAPLFDDKNTFLHNAPYTFERAPGTFKVSAQFADQRITQEVVLEKGAPVVVRMVAKVALRVTVPNVRATVRVDGKNKGETPLELPAFVEPGQPMKIQLVANGFETREFEVTARPGVAVELNEALRKRAASSTPAASPVEAPSFGRLHVRALGVAITAGRLDGEKLPELPFRDHKTRAGRRILTLLNPVEKVNESFPVTVPADGEVLVIVEFEKKGERWKARKPTIK